MSGLLATAPWLRCLQLRLQACKQLEHMRVHQCTWASFYPALSAAVQRPPCSLAQAARVQVVYLCC